MEPHGSENNRAIGGAISVPRAVCCAGLRTVFTGFFAVCCASAFAADPVASISFNGGEQARIVVEARINNQGPFPFVFDTGSINILSLDLAKQLGVKLTGNRKMDAFGGPVETASAILDSITLGPLRMDRTEVAVIVGGPFTKGGLAGFLGWEFLSKLVVEVDYQRGRLSFFDPNTYVYTGSGKRVPITIRGGNVITIPARIFAHDASLQLDSGSSLPLVLFSEFVTAHHLHSAQRAITGYGFGGLTRAMVTRAPALDISGFLIKSPITLLSLNQNGLGHGTADGNMGASLLREFTCVYDVPHKAFYLEPNAWFGQQELADRSGLVLDSRAGSARVLFVYPGSPASSAGIVEGDELADAGGASLTDNQWHDLLDAPAGTSVRLTVKHRNRVRRVAFTLRDYI